MKLLLVTCLAAVALAAPQNFYDQDGNEIDQYGNIIRREQNYRREPEIRIISQRFVTDDQGNYEFGYRQDNDQEVEEVGQSFPGPERGTGSISKTGYFTWKAPNDVQYRVEYVADEDGFQPSGDHLPQGPAQLPEYDEHRAQFPELYEVRDGQYQSGAYEPDRYQDGVVGDQGGRQVFQGQQSFTRNQGRPQNFQDSRTFSSSSRSSDGQSFSSRSSFSGGSTFNSEGRPNSRVFRTSSRSGLV